MGPDKVHFTDILTNLALEMAHMAFRNLTDPYTASIYGLVHLTHCLLRMRVSLGRHCQGIL